MFCRKCGARLEDNAKFCTKCGAAVVTNEAAPESSAPASKPEPAPAPQAQPTQQVPPTQQGQPTQQAQPTQQVPPQSWSQPTQQVPPMQQPSFNGPVYAKGCLAQAFEDMTKIKGVFGRVCQIAFLPAAIALVSILVLIIPVIGWLACPVGLVIAAIASFCGSGYAIEWGRDLSRGKGFDIKKPLLRTSVLSLGVFKDTLVGILTIVAWVPFIVLVIISAVSAGSLALGAIGSYSYGYSSAGNSFAGVLVLLIIVALIAGVILSIILNMVGNATVMHLAVTGRVESALSLGKVWKCCKKELGKLFCATILPEILVGLVSSIISWVLTFIFSFIIGVMVGGYGYYGYDYGYSSNGILGILAVGGGIAIFFLMLLVFVSVFSGVFGQMLKFRALGHWAARYAEDWTHESDDDYAFYLPGEAGYGKGKAPAAQPVQPMNAQQPFAQAAPMQQPVQQAQPMPTQQAPSAPAAPSAQEGTQADAQPVVPDFGSDDKPSA